MKSRSSFASGAGLGLLVGAAFVYIAQRSRARGHLMSTNDQLHDSHSKTPERIYKKMKEVMNRMQGVVARLIRPRWQTLNDDVLAARIRTQVKKLVKNPEPIEIQVSRGRVTLRGPVKKTEAPRLIRRIRSLAPMPVDNQLEVRPDAHVMNRFETYDAKKI